MADWAATKRLNARVVLAEGLTLQGELHLQPRVAYHDGPELPVEMLNRPERFFVLSLAKGGVVFVSKTQVALVAYSAAAAAPPLDRERSTACRTLKFEVMIVGGVEYKGQVQTELPPDHSRPLDYLNAPEDFFTLVTDKNTLCLNRRHVRAVRPLS